VRLLALDTSSIACSVALQMDEVVVERHEEQPREHSRLLMPMIKSVLGEAKATLPELDAIVLGNGPGSFVGMRIAASVAQGLAFGAGLKVVPVSSLAAVAAQVFAEQDAAEVVVTQDAHMNEVYLGIFRQAGDGLPTGVVPERLQGPAAIAELQADSGGPRIAAGFGWQRYPELLAANQECITDVAALLHPHAKHLLALGAAGLSSGHEIEPQEIVPAYLRQKVAEKPGSMP